MAVAGLLVAGIWLADSLMLPPVIWLSLTGIALATLWRLRSRHNELPETIWLSLTVILLGCSLWSVRHFTQDARDLGALIEERLVNPGDIVRLYGRVANIPALETPTTRWNRVRSNTDRELVDIVVPQNLRTLFLIEAGALIDRDGTKIPVRGTCRVLSDGDATELIRWGDDVELLGSIDIADPPMNPGEFDFARHLDRNRISAMMFLKHSAAIKLQSRSSWNPANWMTVIRQETVAALKRHLSPVNQGTAEALLLGNRGHLTPDLERDYIFSGTMHLLAISGLHVGILYLFLLRIGSLLIVPRHQVLILAGVVCVLYCLLTDLRPSVMRATSFIVLNIIGQLFYRDVRMGTQIGATSTLLILADPSIVFDIGAWLSFLAVGALGWVSDQSPTQESRPAPPDEVSWRDRLEEFWRTLQSKLLLSYRQMLAVTLLSAPIVASQFHVVSLIGMVINLLLIPFTTITLLAGFLLVFFGLLLPPVAVIPGFLFDLSLFILNWTVSFSADVPLGFVTIPDLPQWFIPVYYSLLAASAVARQSTYRISFRLSLLVLVIIVFWNTDKTPRPGELICTTLSVGHGNAIVAELPDGRVLLFDAGALNRAERTADVVSRFLWNRGYRMIDAIVISHPDADHYNAIGSLLGKIPVGQVLLSAEFARSDTSDVQAILSSLEEMSLPSVILMHGDRVRLSDVTVEFQQATARESARSSDNASSLVCLLSYAGRRICLPGDLEDYGQKELLPKLPACDLLVSPHHGSLASNNRELAGTVAPAHVFVSSRDHDQRDKLTSIFDSSAVHFTCLEGALTFRVSPEGRITVEAFRATENLKGPLKQAQTEEGSGYTFATVVSFARGLFLSFLP